jgi:hypothetical protein
MVNAHSPLLINRPAFDALTTFEPCRSGLDPTCVCGSGGSDLSRTCPELNRAQYRAVLGLDKPRVSIPLPDGLPSDAWLWLKAGLSAACGPNLQAQQQLEMAARPGDLPDCPCEPDAENPQARDGCPLPLPVLC